MSSREIAIADERRPTVNELANQKGVGQRASGWKLQLFAAEFDALVCTQWICQCLYQILLPQLHVIFTLPY